MRTITKSVYEITELSPEAKETAYNIWLAKIDHVFYDQDWQELIKQVEICFNIDVTACNIDPDGRSYIKYDDYLEEHMTELSGKRLRSYIWNNFRYLWENKYYCNYKTLKNRRSKFLVTSQDCPLTGVFCDNAVMDVIENLWTCHDNYITYADLIECIINSICHGWTADIEYHRSEEFFISECAAQELYFSADGKEMYYSSELD